MSSLLAGPKKRKQANSEKFIDLENKDHEIKPGLKSESDDIEIVENESKRFKAAPSTDFAKSIVEPASSRDQLHNAVGIFLMENILVSLFGFLKW